VFDSARRALARWIAPTAQRLYAGARGSRLSARFGSGGSSSADAELSGSLTQLRARSRQMVRDSAYAKRARAIVVNNIIGSGIGMQAQVKTARDSDRLLTAINDAIETAWADWCEAGRCHTGGAMHFHDLERAAMGQVFDAGDVLVRLHLRRFGDSPIPLAVEMIEAERLAQDAADIGLPPGHELRMGVEVDRFGRAQAYWVRRGHPGDIRNSLGEVDRYERVPADQAFLLRVIDRWPQTRGEPWMHTVLRKLDDMNEYSGSEVAAARASSYYFATITTPEGDHPLNSDTEANGQGVMDIEPLTVQELKPGEELTFHAPSRPNAALDPFMRHMLREVAAGCGTSYESLSRDYSQSNYSSSRLALLDDRDTWKALQQWWIRSFRRPLHKLWLQQAVLARAVPGLNAEAYAVEPGRFEAVLAQTAGGLDIEDVIATRKRELQMFKDAGIEVDTTFTVPVAAPATPDKPDDEQPPQARVLPMRSA
jgi:lambda family phage portal protein